MKVINLFAGPGAGKSTTRALLFGHLKMLGFNCEEVTEYAKDLFWERHNSLLTDQLMILANQNRRLERLKGKVDLVITDSPLLLSLHYKTLNYLPNTFQSLLFELWHTYHNVNFFINRNKPYSVIGRMQTEEEAKKIDIEIKQLLSNNNIDFIPVEADEKIIINITDHLIKNKH